MTLRPACFCTDSPGIRCDSAHCDRIRLGQPYDIQTMCRLCWLYFHSAKHNYQWGGDGNVHPVKGVAKSARRPPCLCDGRADIRCDDEHCDIASPEGAPGDVNRCTVCWKWHHSDPHRVAWGGKAARVQPLPASAAHEEGRRKLARIRQQTTQPCIHLGTRTGETHDSETCGGARDVPIWTCAVHGRCTYEKCLRYREDGRTVTVPWCGSCEDYRDHHVTVNHGAGGLGDSLLGLAAIGGLHADRPDERIRYKVHPDSIPFVRLFDGGYTSLAPHDFDLNKDEPPNATDVQLNLGYNDEVRHRCPLPRWERYCRNAGASRPVLPTLKERPRLLELGAAYRGCIALAPFSTWANREYPVMHWLTIEKLLRDAGRRVVILDSKAERCHRFVSEKLIGRDAAAVVAAVLNCAALVGNDSGLAHLAGILGVPTVALCGQTTGAGIFGLYPDVTVLQGSLACAGCWWQPPYHSTTCEPHCPALATIAPGEVVSQLGGRA